MQTWFLLLVFVCSLPQCWAFLIARKDYVGGSQLKATALSKVHFDSSSGATSPMLVWLNQEEIHIFWLTQGKPLRQPADSLDWHSHVSNTMATCWSLWCSGKFSFLYNTCAHSLYPTLNFLSTSPWLISSMPSSTVGAYGSVTQMHSIFNNQSFLCREIALSK